MTAKLRKLVPGAVAALSAAAVFTAATATIAAASTPRDDLIVDATATVENTTFSTEMATGDVFTSQFSVVDNLTGGEGDGSEECAVVKSDDEGKVFQCAMILRLPGGDIHISGIYPSDASAPGVGTVIGGSGDYEKVTGAAEITMKEQTITIKVGKGSAGEEPAEQPGEEPSEEPAEQPSEDPAEEPAEDPSAEQPADQPAEDPASEQPAEDPASEEPAAEEPAVEQPDVPETPDLQDPPVGPIAPEPVAAPDVTTPDSVIAGPNGQ